MPARRTLALLFVVVFGAACASDDEPLATASGGSETTTSTLSSIPAPTAAEAPGATWETDVPGPNRIRIERIGVDADVIDLGLHPDGTLETPDDDYMQTGWWSGGSAPGEQGPTVIVGHVDDHRGPAVFYRLGDLENGDEVEVERDDGEAVRYIVTGQEQVAKDEFPTERVYGPTDAPELRLVTCGGRFDRSSRHYDDNIIVYLRISDD